MTSPSTGCPVKERPILMSGPMVRVILEGRKSQTRRVIKEPEITSVIEEIKSSECIPIVSTSLEVQRLGPSEIGLKVDEVGSICTINHIMREEDLAELFCPYGVPGDRLWVRECFRHVASGEVPGPMRYGVAYRADGVVRWQDRTTRIVCDGPRRKIREISTAKIRWSPSIHMPRGASRIVLEVTDVRVERLQEISAEDVYAEGVGPGPTSHIDIAREWFAQSWEKLNAKRGYSWESNPWVWVVSLRGPLERM